MSAFWSSVGLPEIVAGIMVIALNAYALMGGADYGGGVWDLLATGPRRDAQRDAISHSIAPIWEANHVWLIVVVVMLFTGFPVVFQDLSIVLHLPLTLMLIGIVLRGSAFVFRSYGSRTAGHRARWGRVFALSSIITPILLGDIIGAVASGAVGRSVKIVEQGGGTFADVFVMPWLSAFPIVVGLLALTLFAFLAAVYLAYAIGDRDLQEDFRRRGLAAAIATFFLAAVALLLARTQAPMVASGVSGAMWAIPLHLLTGLAAITAIYALYARRYSLARIAAAAQVTFILWGWILSQYPSALPDGPTLDEAAAPRATLVLLLVGLAIGSAILIPALRYLFALFAQGGVAGAE